MNLEKYKYAEGTRKPNFLKIPVNNISMDSEGIKEFNAILKSLKENKNLSIIKRTKSGGISFKTIWPAWDIRATTTVVEITILMNCKMYRIQCKNTKNNNNPTGITGHQAFIKFKKILKKYGIDINDYAINNGMHNLIINM